MIKRLSLVIVLFALLLAACQAAPTPAPTTAPVEGEESSTESTEPVAPPTEGAGGTTGGAYPNPSVAYPNPDVPYPGPGGIGTVDWQSAVELLTAGQVTQVIQAHDLTVTLTLTDGQMIMTTEPSIDEVLRVIEQCGDPCRNIGVATE
jgi:hypothetical protein